MDWASILFRNWTILLGMSGLLLGQIPGVDLHDWPTVQGQGGYAPASESLALVDDAAEIRLAWENEHHTGVGKTTAAGHQDFRLDKKNAFQRDWFYGGCSSPVVGNGLVFVTYFRGSGDARNPKPIAKGGSLKPDNFPDRLLRYAADDCVVAIDANTGKTRWQVVEEGQGINHFFGKRGHFAVSPAYAAGTLFWLGSSGILYAHRTADGERLWATKLPGLHEQAMELLEWRKAGSPPQNQPVGHQRFGTWRNGIVVAGGVVIAPDMKGGLIGYHAGDGSLIWQLETPVLGSHATPCLWMHKGHPFVLCQRGGKLHLIDAMRGQIRWSVPAGGYRGSPSLRGDVLVTTTQTVVDQGRRQSYDRWGCFLIEESGARVVWQLPDRPRYLASTHPDQGAIRRVALGKRHAYIQQTGLLKKQLPDLLKADTAPRILIADLRTGAVVHEAPCGDNRFSLPIIAENLLITQHDVTHGWKPAGISLYQLRPTGTRFEKESHRELASLFRYVSGYELPIESPYYRGRLYMRTHKGLACLDLRRASTLAAP